MGRCANLEISGEEARRRTYQPHHVVFREYASENIAAIHDMAHLRS